MFIAIVLQKQPRTNTLEMIYGAATGDTLESAAAKAEKSAMAARGTNPTWDYRVVIGKATHTIKPPNEKIEIVELIEALVDNQ